MDNKYKFNIGDRVRFKKTVMNDNLAGKVFTITGQSWFNGPVYYVDLPVYFPSRDFWTFPESDFENEPVGRA